MTEIHPQVVARREPLSFPYRVVLATGIEGATVYNRDGDRLGTTSSLIADNQSGRIEYAVCR